MTGVTLAALAIVGLTTTVGAAVPDGPAPAAPLGLHAAADFVVTTGDYSSLLPPPRLYFAKEWIAVPRDGVPVSGYAKGVDAFDDVRAWGSWAVATPAEYQGKVPSDPEDVKRVPVPARPFPSNLREPDLLPEPSRPSDLPLAVWIAIGVGLLVALVGYLIARFR